MFARIGIAALGLVVFVIQGNAATIRGTVVDHAGKPAAGANVRVAKLAFREPLQTHEATTDAEGAFSIDVAPGTWGVFTRKGNEGGPATFLELSENDDGKPAEPVKLTLGPPTILKGRLLDAETGDPVKGGYVVMDDASKLPVDADGRFEAPGLEMKGHQSFAICPGYASSRLLFDTTLRPDAELEVKLNKGGSVTGRVTDAEGKPVPGALVGRGGSGNTYCGSALLRPCDENGRYVYENLPIGESLLLIARAPGYRDARDGTRRVVIENADKPVEWNLTVFPDPAAKTADAPKSVADARTVSGTVIADGKPVADAVVQWGMHIDSNPVPESKTDAEGRFTLKGIPDDINILSVFAEGLQPRFPLVEGKGDQSIEIDLKPGATIRGRVIDDAGRSIAGARIIPLIAYPQPEWGAFKPWWSGFVYLRPLDVTTDADGSFTLEGMPDAVKADVLAPQHSSARHHALSLDPSKNVIILPANGAIRGRVVDSQGNPVRNFRVKIEPSRERKVGEKSGGFYLGYTTIGVAFTRDDGVFTLSGLTTGDVAGVTVISDGFGTQEVRRMVVDSIDHLRPADSFIIKLDPPRILRVHVVSDDAKPIDNARITVIGANPERQFQLRTVPDNTQETVTAATGPQGRAVFDALPFAKGTIVVRTPGFVRKRLPWTDGNLEALAILEPESTISGTVKVVGEKPSEDLQMVLRWSRLDYRDVPIDPTTGRYSVDGLPSGEIQLSIGPKGGLAFYRETIILKRQESLLKDITITPADPAKP
jgi:protocatechuate 3,4-dioxygenase beta subunit